MTPFNLAQLSELLLNIPHTTIAVGERGFATPASDTCTGRTRAHTQTTAT
jgi:hypothetical protein